MVDRALALRLIEGKPWYHDFEIVPGVRTRGVYDPREAWNDLKLPADMRGLSVADVGASNGFYSFQARSQGARVVAFDYRHKDNSGFGLAQHINGMTDIEHHQVNILAIPPGQFGKFDIVLALGLLYHVADPYRGLAVCTDLCADRLLLESYCIDSLVGPDLASQPIMRFISDPERFPGRRQPNEDRSNFWGFTGKCLESMLEDLGFAVDRRIQRGQRVFMDCHRNPADESHLRLELAYGTMQRIPAAGDPDAPETWHVF